LITQNKTVMSHLKLRGKIINEHGVNNLNYYASSNILTQGGPLSCLLWFVASLSRRSLGFFSQTDPYGIWLKKVFSSGTPILPCSIIPPQPQTHISFLCNGRYIGRFHPFTGHEGPYGEKYSSTLF